MADGPDHHAMNALRMNTGAGASQSGGGASGDIPGVDGKIMGGKGDEPLTKGFDKSITGEKGNLDNNLMESLNAGGDRFGGKINAMEGLQSVTVNPASGKSIGTDGGVGAVQVAPSHNMFGGQGQGR